MSYLQLETASSVMIFVNEISNPSRKNRWQGSQLLSAPALVSLIEYSRRTSSSPLGRTGMTHLGFEMSSSNFCSFGSGKFSMRASVSTSTTVSVVSVDEIRWRGCCCCCVGGGCAVGEIVGGGTVFGELAVRFLLGEPPSSPSEREFGPETVISVFVRKTWRSKNLLINKENHQLAACQI